MGGVFIEKNIIYAIFPLDLIQNENYSFLSCEEKLLYILLLNRANISAKNTKIFQDSKGVFIFYSNKQIQNHLHLHPNFLCRSIFLNNNISLTPDKGSQELLKIRLTSFIPPSFSIIKNQMEIK